MQPAGFQQKGRLSPLGYTQGWGAKLSEVKLDQTQGTLVSTGLQTDMALQGNGMFEIDVDGKKAYTRDGAFQWSVNPNDLDNVYLTTKEGYYVQGTQGPLKVPENREIAIDDQGRVFSYLASDPSSTVPAGQLSVVRVIRPQYLEALGDNLFRVPDSVTNTQGQILQGLATTDDFEGISGGRELAGKISVRQGSLEQSNVNLSDEMTELLMVQRAYQLSSRAVTSSDTMMGLANNLRG